MIEFDLHLCTGCRRCEVACAFSHFEIFSPVYSRIKVVKIEEIGIDGPVVCLQCKERYCIQCPEEALSIGLSGEIRVDNQKCTGCGVCKSRCPIGAIEIIDECALICDLCNGNPECVSACNSKALSFQSNGKIQFSLSSFKNYPNKSPQKKRFNFINKHAQKVRLLWKNNLNGRIKSE